MVKTLISTLSEPGTGHQGFTLENKCSEGELFSHMTYYPMMTETKISEWKRPIILYIKSI